MDRRHFVKGSLVFGAGMLSGCCTNAPSIPEIDHMLPFGSSPLGFTPPKNAAYRAVDAHMHIFNASDLQVGGFLRGPIAREFDSPIREILINLSEVIEHFAKYHALSASEEMKVLKVAANQPSVEDSKRILRDKSQKHTDEVITEFMRKIRNTRAEKQINAILADNPISYPNKQSPFRKIDEALMREAFDHTASQRQSTVDPFASSTNSLKGVLSFVCCILSQRYQNLMTYQDAYSGQNDEIFIGGCHAALVDFDYWIGSCDHTVSRLKDQVILLDHIAKLSGDYLRPLVAYNPWTDIKENDDSLNLVRDALTNRSFRGVKIYPPMGFFPYGNEDNDNYPSSAPHPNRALLDEKLKALFKLCREREVPVMAHSNMSMGRNPDHDILSGPEGWKAFFSDKENAGSRVNLAHFGGDIVDCGDWTERFIEVMAMDGAENLYADLGYWDGLARGDTHSIKKFAELLTKPLKNGQIVADRIMFGTDWYMLSRAEGWKSYAHEFLQVLEKMPINDDIINKILSKNVETLYGAA